MNRKCSILFASFSNYIPSTRQKSLLSLYPLISPPSFTARLTHSEPAHAFSQIRSDPVPVPQHTFPMSYNFILYTPFLHILPDPTIVRTGLEPYPPRLIFGRWNGEEGLEDREGFRGVDDYRDGCLREVWDLALGLALFVREASAP